MSNICKFCGADKLHWNYNILSKKWELLDNNDTKHKCVFNKKDKDKSNRNTREFRKDSKIKKALREFKEKLDKENKKVYYLK